MSTSTLPPRVDSAPPEEGCVQLERQEDGIAILRLGTPGEKIVTLTERRLHSLAQALDRLAADTSLRGLIVTGPGPGMFAAGADIKLIESVTDVAEGQQAARFGQDLFGRFAQLAVPVVGAIEGPCLGGGLELALGLGLRVVSDHKSTQLGLPEVKLGIVPGFGGTQRLTRLVGLPKALELILQGKLLDPKQALRAGVADRVVPGERLLEAARQELERLVRAGKKAPRRRLTGFARWASRLGFLRAFVARQAGKQLSHGQARFFPAPRAALSLCLDALQLPPAAGFAREAQALGELIVSPVSKALVRLFFLTERSKKLGRSKDARVPAQAVIVGGGVMGAGIASLLAQKQIRTRLCDLDREALARAKARLQADLDKRLRSRRMPPHAAQAIQDRLAVATDWGNLARCDLFLEAVVEKLDLKQKLFREAVARGLPDSAILASNTSSLPIDRMADGVPHPERVVGIHFFNPPEKMPLVEVIRGKRTSEAAVASACALAVALGKFPIVVQDSPGFLVNRCLAPYLNEAAALLLEGNEPEAVDKAMLEIGMPMGPARLLDEVGYDVAAKVSEVMVAAFPERMQASPLLAAMVAAGRLGKKSGGGLYDASGKQPGPGRTVLAALRRQAGTLMPSPRERLVARLLYPMVDEAWRCLAEGIVASEEDLDLGLVMGIGFPPHIGGITRYARSVGIGRIVACLDELARSAPRFAPSAALRAAAI